MDVVEEKSRRTLRRVDNHFYRISHNSYSGAAASAGSGQRTEKWMLSAMSPIRKPLRPLNVVVGQGSRSSSKDLKHCQDRQDYYKQKEHSKQQQHGKHSEKKCFSPEVLQLGRNMQLKKKSTTAEVAVLPPKRMRKEEFGFGYNKRHDQYDHHHHHEVRSSCSSSYHHSTHCSSSKRHSSSSQVNQVNHRIMAPPPPPKLAIKNEPENVRCAKLEPTIPLFTLSRVLMGEESRPSIDDVLFSSSGFPWEKWAQTDFSVDQFRKMLTSGKNFCPVSVIETEDYVFIKLEHPKELAIKSLTLPHQHEPQATFYQFLTYPLTFPFKVISGVLKWIIG